jgi:hypothetical protein
MTDAKRLADDVVADIRRGWSVSVEDLFIAALVVLPFTGTLAILVGTMASVPDAVLVILTGLLQGVATFWNAGWRARTSE